MGYPTKVQVIDRKNSEQWYVNFPAAIAQAMEFRKSETVEWVIQDKGTLILRRTERAAEGGRADKKKTGRPFVRNYVVVGPVHGCLRSASDVRARQAAWFKFTCVFGQTHGEQSALHVRSTVRRLVG